MGAKITKKTSSHNTSSSKNRSLGYIVIHFTAGTSSRAGSAANTASYFATTQRDASADFIVDDATIIQYNPDIRNRYCWHCGGSKYSGTKGGSKYGICKNSNSIGIEICSSNKTGKVTNANDSNWYYTEAALNNARELVKYLMEEYGIPASNVIRHWDVNGKPCPGIKGWNADSGDESAWNAFKKSLTDNKTPAAKPSNTPAKPAAPSGSFVVKITADSLNIRKGPGTNYAIAGSVKKNGAYTIVETKGGWGKLKSGSGWISISEKYVKRI